MYRDRRVAVTQRAPADRLARRLRRVEHAHRGTSLPLPLPSDEPLPFEPLFEPLRVVRLVDPLVDPLVVPLGVVRPPDPLVVPLPVWPRVRRVVLLPLPVPVLLPLPVSLSVVGTDGSGEPPFIPVPALLPVSVPLPIGAPDPDGVPGEPVRSGSFVCGSGGLPGTVAPGDVALLLFELLVLYELL